MPKGRAQQVADRTVQRLFAGRRSDNVERHLSRDDIRDIVVMAYDIGYGDGQKVPRSGESDEGADA